MKKLISLFTTLILTSTIAFADDMRFIQVTDTFFTKSNPQTVKTLENLVEKINSTKNVEFVVFTGNNIAKPNPNDLKEFLKITKSLKKPYYLVLGNKDVNKSKDLSKQEYSKIVSKNNKHQRRFSQPNFAFAKKDYVFLFVDGSKDIIPSSNGYYRTTTLSWLDKELKKHNNKKAIIFQHFPIIPPANDELKSTQKPEEYLSLLEEHGNIEAIISGHFGINSEKEINGILHITTAPAPQYRVIDIIDYKTNNPTFWSTIKQ